MNINTQDIINDIKSTPGFQEMIDGFIKNALQMVFDIKTDCSIDNQSLSYSELLKLASVFALSDDNQDKKLAYIITIYTWLACNAEMPNIIHPVKVILSRLSNFPAIQLLEQRTTLAQNSDCPLTKNTNIFSALEIMGRQIGNSINFLDKVILTDFQKELWDYLDANNSVSFSAPTSAGKSFVLKQYVIKKITATDTSKILYILPTRALINETITDLRKYIKDHNLSDEILLTSIPTNKSSAHKIIYLLTQERASVLVDNTPDIKFDLIVVDEAQSISSSQRGIILQNVLHDILGQNDTPVVFSCPFVKNMRFFNEIFGKDIKIIQNQNSTVVQNLITLNIKDSKINLVLITDKQNIKIGSIECERKKSSIPQRKNRLAFFAKKFTKIGDKSIIFANGPDDAEQIANLLYDEMPDIELDQATLDLIEHIKTHLHKDFSLALMLKHGIAFHYGNLPTNVRACIEDIFKNPNGSIKFLICTSTLLEGVNLPAQNIFIESPEKGSGKDKTIISPHEFWNLAGRAGRLAKDFYGNVFLINYQNWDEQLADAPKEDIVKSSLYDTIYDSYGDIVKYLSAPNETKISPSIESAVNKMYSEYKRGKLSFFLNNSSNILSESQKRDLHDLLEKLDKSFISLPASLLRKNPHISIINQQKLYNYLLQLAETDDFELYFPTHPTDGLGYPTLKNIMNVSAEYLSLKQISSKHINRLVVLSSQWMKGIPIASMIKNTLDYESKTPKPKKVNTVVRNILEFVERDIRFNFMIRIKCYVDIFSYILSQKNDQRQVPPIHLFMEMGASQQSMISFMGIGLSRPTAKALDELISNKEMNEEQAYEWLKNNVESLYSRGITGVTLSEIKKFI